MTIGHLPLPAGDDRGSYDNNFNRINEGRLLLSLKNDADTAIAPHLHRTHATDLVAELPRWVD